MVVTKLAGSAVQSFSGSSWFVKREKSRQRARRRQAFNFVRRWVSKLDAVFSAVFVQGAGAALA